MGWIIEESVLLYIAKAYAGSGIVRRLEGPEINWVSCETRQISSRLSPKITCDEGRGWARTINRNRVILVPMSEQARQVASISGHAETADRIEVTDLNQIAIGNSNAGRIDYVASIAHEGCGFGEGATKHESNEDAKEFDTHVPAFLFDHTHVCHNYVQYVGICKPFLKDLIVAPSGSCIRSSGWSSF